MPHLYGRGYADGAQGVLEYVVMSRMPGEALIRRPANGAQHSALIRRVGELLARLHQIPITPLLDGSVDVPLDRHVADLSKRLESRFANVADVIAHHPERWSFPTPFQDVVATALAMLPTEFSPVIVHSNPGPTHVFHDGNATVTGLIDFGDSYLSHPAMDLRSWPDPADRIALRTAYLADRPPPPDFDAAWAASMIATDATVLVSQPQLATAAAADLATRMGAD